MTKRRAKHRRSSATRRWRAVLVLTLAILAAAAAARLVSSGASALPVKIAAASTPGTRAHGRLIPPPPPVRTPPARMPTAPARQISGQSVTAIGDSVMVASTPALEQDLPGIYVNAVVGRQFATGLQVLASLRQSGQLRPVVVFGLGTNGTVTAGQISQLFATIGPRRLLVLVNTFEDRPWEQEVNATLAAARNHPHVVLANWFAAIEHRTYLLWPDGIHPQPAGGVLYAGIVKTAVERAANLP